MRFVNDLKQSCKRIYYENLNCSICRFGLGLSAYKSCIIAIRMPESIQKRRNWVILRRGHSYICNRKDKIIHGLSPSVKCAAPLFRDMSLAKV